MLLTSITSVVKLLAWKQDPSTKQTNNPKILEPTPTQPEPTPTPSASSTPSQTEVPRPTIPEQTPVKRIIPNPPRDGDDDD